MATSEPNFLNVGFEFSHFINDGCDGMEVPSQASVFGISLRGRLASGFSVPEVRLKTDSALVERKCMTECFDGCVGGTEW